MPDETIMTPAEAAHELATAQALSRRDEAIANIHRSRGIDSEFVQRAKATEEEEARRERLSRQSADKDYAGTRLDVADAMGNRAPNAEVANTGGIGVAASNSTESGEQAQTAAQVQAPVSDGLGTGAQSAASTGEGTQGGQAAADDAASKVEIPDNWSELSWPERQALAKSVARGETVRNGDDADRVIKAEIERRKA